MSSLPSEQGAPPVAGEGLLRPWLLICVALLVLNDHVLKAAYPGLVTGKLSDVVGLAFFPVFLQALVEIAARSNRRWHRSRTVLWATTLATATVFAWVKLTPLGGETYRIGLGLLSLPVRGAQAWLSDHELHVFARVALTQDPTDLFALPAVALPLWLDGRMRRHARRVASRVA